MPAAADGRRATHSRSDVQFAAPTDHRRWTTLHIILGNLASSVLLVLINKATMNEFPYPTTLTAFHQASTVDRQNLLRRLHAHTLRKRHPPPRTGAAPSHRCAALVDRVLGWGRSDELFAVMQLGWSISAAQNGDYPMHHHSPANAVPATHFTRNTRVSAAHLGGRRAVNRQRARRQCRGIGVRSSGGRGDRTGAGVGCESCLCPDSEWIAVGRCAFAVHVGGVSGGICHVRASGAAIHVHVIIIDITHVASVHAARDMRIGRSRELLRILAHQIHWAGHVPSHWPFADNANTVSLLGMLWYSVIKTRPKHD
ncbi:hypothetical protein SeMB42_g02110 [Synchytrium endobioticum]|uniref:Uncharacterized protein n=1 Tax=Synchytrium endobioticum TaxID=286115 RepID=A0A507DGV8_9FUNG|nr:hypothetical protein SeMB42_g02110 [Synchytrium endobioticum]